MTSHSRPAAPEPPWKRGPWLATARGGMWSVLDPHPDDVTLEDIAAGLARTCRYGGQIRDEIVFYSVAEHCVLMTDWAVETGAARWREEALAILLHDASEAWLVDMQSPLKGEMPDFRVIEGRAQAAAEAAFGLDSVELRAFEPKLKEIDMRILIDERRALIREPALGAGLEEIWKVSPDLAPLGVRIEGLAPGEARRRFLDAARRVCRLPLRNPDLAELHARMIPGIETAEMAP